jgi:hypothetical protein
MSAKTDKQVVEENAKALVAGLIAQSMALAVIAAVLDEARSNVRDMAFERLRNIEAETGQLKLIVGEGPKQRASDRSAEDQAVLDIVQLGKPLTAVELAKEAKVGARIHAILSRLAKRRFIHSNSKGPKAVWLLGPPAERAPPPAAPPPTPPAAAPAAPVPAAVVQAPAPPLAPPAVSRPRGRTPTPPDPKEDW